MTKRTRGELDIIINDIAEKHFATLGSYSAACGCFQTLLASVMADIPAHKQNELIAVMNNSLKGLPNGY